MDITTEGCCPVRINKQILKLLQPATRVNDVKHKKQQTKQTKGMIALLQAINELQKRGDEGDDNLREMLADAFSLFEAVNTVKPA